MQNTGDSLVGMGLDEADLPELAELFAPMATPEMLGAALPPSAPPIANLHGDVDRTRAWLQSLDDSAARAILSRFSARPVVAAALAHLDKGLSRPSMDLPWRWVLDLYPVVGRDDLWKNLPELLEARNKRILVVRGGRQVGKTYTAEYILADLPQRATSREIRVVHQRVDGAGSVENVVLAVLSKLDLAATGMPSLDVQKSSEVAAKKEWWIKETALWFVDKLHMNRARQVWLAFDGHSKNDAHPDLSMFFTEVTALIGRRYRDDNGCRLVLIDYPEGVSGAAPVRLTAREEVRFPTRTDVVGFVRSALGETDAADARAGAIWATVMQASEIDRMPILASELQALKP